MNENIVMLIKWIAGKWRNAEHGHQKNKTKNARFRLRDCPPPQVEIWGT